MARLGVNIDHVATLRQARGVQYPEPVVAAGLAELGGAEQITIHLREDRRHIQDRDLHILKQTLTTRLNLEMAATDEMVAIATTVKPDEVCLVPEKRQELTTEGGLDVAGNSQRIASVTQQLQQAHVLVSLFIDPTPEQVRASAAAGADYVELHTGAYAEQTGTPMQAELDKLRDAALLASELGLGVNAGHGLHYTNVHAVAALPKIDMLNIGHSIIARAVMVGLQHAVREMVALIHRAD